MLPYLSLLTENNFELSLSLFMYSCCTISGISLLVFITTLVILNLYNSLCFIFIQAHQRRISRQLLLGSSAKDPTAQPLSLNQFKKYKPTPIMQDSYLSPPVDGKHAFLLKSDDDTIEIRCLRSDLLSR